MEYLIYQTQDERIIPRDAIIARVRELKTAGVVLSYHAEGILLLTDLSGEYANMFKRWRLARSVNCINQELY